MYRFVSATSSLPATMTAPAAPQTSGQAVLNNLLVHVPTEAVTLATTLSPLVADGDEVNLLRAWILFLGAAGLAILVRYVQDASRAVWITTLVAFVLWMSLIPNGALAMQFPWIKDNSIAILMLAAIWSAGVTVAASLGKIK